MIKGVRGLILELVPSDGSTVGNQSLLAAIRQRLPSLAATDYQAARDALIAEGILGKGQGRGGSVYLVDGNAADGTTAEDDDANAVDEIEGDEEAFELTSPEEAATVRRATGAKKVRRKAGKPAQVLSYRHLEKRANNPEVGMVHPENDPDQPKTVWTYDPHIDPALQFDVGRGRIEALIDGALASSDPERMRDALLELKRLQEPYLAWTGKAERTSFEVDTVSLHVHERIDPATILATVRKRLKRGEDKIERPTQADLFAAPFENLPLRQAIDFYKHEKSWSNRLIAGDSLLVMNSLLRKEGMAGQVQMIYIDPPYGIKYSSNFQPFTGSKKVKDGADIDLTQEPETIKAFRDTWEIGVHSYLTHLSDRLYLAKELLKDTGSVFVQISDQNLHHIMELMSGIFGSENYLNIIPFSKTSGVTTQYLASNVDFLIWYAKDKKKATYHQLYLEKSQEAGTATNYGWIELSSGRRRGLTKAEKQEPNSIPSGAKVYKPDNIASQGNPDDDFFHQGKKYNQEWKTNHTGRLRLSKSNRLHEAKNSLQYVRYINDFPCIPVTQLWNDMQTGSFTEDKVYVVQTALKLLERCILITTDPGDLVIDPTCGSGTTAVAAEKWGRRWITCDTSRVAITLAKQRLITASYDYYVLRYPHEGLRGGFNYQAVPHITLKSIANNPDIDDIYNRMHPVVEAALADLNAALKGTPIRLKIAQGGRKGTIVDFAAPDTKTMKLPDGQSVPVNMMLEWEVPFDWPEKWPDTAKAPFEAFHNARQAMQRKMDESIAAHAEPEIIYDKPEIDPNRLRITGPFSVEAVPSPTVLSLDETQPAAEADTAIARSGETSRQAMWRDELMKTGIRGRNGQILRFAELEAIPGLKHLHASGTFADTGERAVISFGPEHAALEQRQVELALSEAERLRPAPKFIVFCAFTFDPEASKDIDEVSWPGVTLLKAQMNTDLLTEDLKKARASNQSFWLMGQPDVDVRKRDDGLWEVEVNGFDYFNPRTGELVSGGKSKIAMWALDTDYDQRSLFPQQVFFPMAGSKDGWDRLRKTIRAELDEELLGQFHGTVSLPFAAGENKRAAIKIVDDRGIESLKIVPLDD